MDDLHRSNPSSSSSKTLTLNLVQQRDPYQLQGQHSTPTPLLLTDGRAEAPSSASPMEVDDDDEWEEEEEEDVVVREIDVFLKPSLEQNSELCVMQFPLRPSWRPYELDKGSTEVRMKPRQSEVEVVLSMDVDSEYYDKNVAEPLRIQKQILSSSSEASFLNDYASSPEASCVNDYAVGLLIKDQLHLNRVQRVLQFRPSLKHLKDADKQKKHKSVEVDTKFDKGKGKLVSEDLKEKIDHTEPWVSLEYNAKGSKSSLAYLKKMLAQQDDNVQFMMKGSDYLNSLCPATSSTGKFARGPSKSFFPLEPLEERLIKWLRKGRQVNRFDALLHLDYTFLSSADEKDKFLEILQRHAYLVQGLWVSKSSLLYEGHAVIQRDYLLFLFSSNPVIPNKKLKELRLNHEDLKHMMRPLAYERSCLNDWKFREERDLSFIKGYPLVVKEQEDGWLSRGDYLTESAHKVQKRLPISFKSVACKGKATVGKVNAGSRSIKEQTGPGSLAAAAISNETREYLIKALLQVFSDRKARSMNSIQRELRDLALSRISRPKEDPKTNALVAAVASAASAPPSALQSVISQVAVEIHNVYVLKSGDNPALDPFRRVIIKLFQEKEPNAKLRKHEIKEAVKSELKREITDSEYNQVLKGLCVSSNGAWLLRRDDNLE
ncbi:DNA-directed RNA polymerase III subunit RPC5-like isoform X1 [Iris pallida]|uniref:DNA-directed RNA polymerase III subunit RPC5-like isoform X1 n=1 Tax=Iris pallida TaxID=29817 RepID=A0AAX6GKW4_IRIPA|nr:DNA-directed RNA polymerase III subunit RPC5-like isoform X1 [Iris pallida]